MTQFSSTRAQIKLMLIISTNYAMKACKQKLLSLVDGSRNCEKLVYKTPQPSKR